MTTAQFKRKNVRIPDPTPKEIRARADAIRRTWGTLEETTQKPQKSPTNEQI